MYIVHISAKSLVSSTPEFDESIAEKGATVSNKSVILNYRGMFVSLEIYSLPLGAPFELLEPVIGVECYSECFVHILFLMLSRGGTLLSAIS